jgi:protein O-GlcNAc transferase
MTVQQAFNLATQHHQAGRLSEAETIYRQILAQQPNHDGVLHLLGVIAYQSGQHQQAIELISRAIAVNPRQSTYQNNLGNVFKELGRIDEAIAAYQVALQLKPDYAYAYNNLGVALKADGQFDAAIKAYRTSIRFKPDNMIAHDNLLFCLNYHPDYSSRAIFEELVHWNRLHAEPLKKFIQPYVNDRDPERRLKIGYVSGDFREHVVGRNLLPLFKAHHHESFEIFCYTNSNHSDAVTDQLHSYADVWHNITSMSDQQAAQIIREDQIDLLVDLALHTGGNRLLIFAHKPAPVQLTFMGYPGTTGMDAMDYRLTDPYLDPPGLFDSHYSEESIRLPNTFWCYDPQASESRAAAPDINALPALQSGIVTFGCLNNFLKVNDGVLQLWAKVLAAVPHSHLILLAPAGQARRWVQDKLQAQGIDAMRVEFVEHKPRADYLRSYHRIDLGLDTLPYNGHTTSLDSFWMGVPVVTLVGQTMVGRAGLSQLSNLGLKELAAQTPDEYVNIAVKLARDLPRLAELRKTIRQRMEASPLMDVPHFAHDIETAYRQMWRRWCAGN